MMSSTIETLRNVTTGTITTMLLKKGIRRSWMAGAMPLGFSGKRVVGPAFTLRFVPVREDLATPASWSNPISTRSAIEAMPKDCVVVADAMGVTGAGIFGDILCMRMVKLGVTALITDGVMRDKHGVGDQRGDAKLDHAHAQDVAEDAGAGHAHGVGDDDAVFRHGLDRAAGGDRIRPACRRGQVLAHRHEP